MIESSKIAWIARPAIGLVLLPLLAACSFGGLSDDAKIIADACSKDPHFPADKCQCFAGQLQSRLPADLLHMAALGQSDLKALYEFARNRSGNDVAQVTDVSSAALKTCGLLGVSHG